MEVVAGMVVVVMLVVSVLVVVVVLLLLWRKKRLQKNVKLEVAANGLDLTNPNYECGKGIITVVVFLYTTS